MEACLVAGGAGFIGSKLTEQLLKDDLSVICVDNLLTGSRRNIQEFEENPHFKFLELDITEDLEEKIAAQENPDYIFHLASPASPNRKSATSYVNKPIETLLANSFGTYHLLNLALKHKAKFLYASSSEVYGDPTVSPQKENYYGNVNPCGVRSVYDEGKRFGEAITMAYVRKHHVDARIVRIFNTYGPNMQAEDGRVVSNFIVQALTDKPFTVYGQGKQTRSFCYIDDMVVGLKTAMFSDKTAGQVFNLGNPDEYEIAELAKIIKELTNSQSEIVYEPLPEDDPKRRKPDIGKAQRILGWTPKASLKEGLKATIKYFKGQNL